MPYMLLESKNILKFLPCSCSQLEESSLHSSLQTGCHSTLYSTVCPLSLCTFSPARNLCSNGSRNVRRSTFCFWPVGLKIEGEKMDRRKSRKNEGKKCPANFLAMSSTSFQKRNQKWIKAGSTSFDSGKGWGLNWQSKWGWEGVRQEVSTGGSSINTSPLISDTLKGQTHSTTLLWTF